MGRVRVFGERLLVACVVLLAQASSAGAYSQYSQNRDATNCAACHGDFNSGSYVSNHDGVAWGTHLMAGHNAMMSSDCGACHLASGRFPVQLNSSAGGTLGFSTSGCVGCHGRTADAGHGTSDGRGAGLRQHHDRSGVTVCRTCHDDADTTAPSYTPVAESVSPFNYFTPDSNHSSKPTDSCDADGTESRYGLTGLDNDGNGLYDGADPACAVTTTTTTTTLGGGSTTTTLAGGTTTTSTLPDDDADNDGTPDDEDPCNNSGAHDISIKPKVMLKRIDTVANDEGLLIKGELVLATPFANLDTAGLRVIGLRQDGTPAFDIAISGSVTADEKKIQFRDDTGANNGITKFQLKNRSNKAPNQVKVLVKGKGGNYPFAAGDDPIRAIVVVGDGSIGDCGETAFDASDCVFNGAGNTMKCQ